MPLKLAAIVIFKFHKEVRWRTFMIDICMQNFLMNLTEKEFCKSVYLC